MKPIEPANPGGGASVFLIVQLLLLSAAVGLASHRVRRLDAGRRLPAARRLPWIVSPQYDNPLVVSDEQLRGVLCKLRPRLRGGQPRMNHVEHALRMWGVDANFTDPECLSGRELRELLTDHKQFADYWGEDTDPFLMSGRRGVEVRVKQGAASASHVDHTLAALAEVGTPIDFPLRTRRGRTTVEQMLAYSLRDFRLNQQEYEWSALAYALYLAPTSSWRSAENQEMTFDRLAERMMRQPYRQGVCLGHHRLHALTILLRIDAQQPFLSPALRERMVAFLQQATARLIRSQRDEGCWDRRWSGEPAPAASRLDNLTGKVLATGHALEWWALAPEETLPPREVVVRAGQWLARTIDQMDAAAIRENYTYLTHAGRALAMWRGRFPADFLPLSDPLNDRPADPSPADAAREDGPRGSLSSCAAANGFPLQE